MTGSGRCDRQTALAACRNDTVDPDTAQPRLRPLCIHRLFEINIPEREMVLNPILPQKGLAMLYAARGIGKTHLACAISYAAATG